MWVNGWLKRYDLTGKRKEDRGKEERGKRREERGEEERFA